ncbi:MAG: FHA domain-containing protein [Chloroflexi bacterium]|nr:FHA domain-containing protein [Chloroflexota bacterium]
MTAQFQLVIRTGPNVGKVFPLEATAISIGRELGNTIVINDAEVSRNHAKLTWQGAGYVIEDTGSTNGTFVNKQRISAPHAVKAGDLVSLSENISLMFEATGDPNATMISSSAQAVKTAIAAAPPIPQPRPIPTAPPAPAYSGRAPVGPQPAGKRANPWLIIGLILLLLLCACAAVFVVIDQLNLYCTVLPFLFPGVCP